MGITKRRQSVLKEESLNDELNKVHKVLTDVSTHKEGWRKVEDPAFNTIMKVCSKITGKIGSVSCIESEDAAKVKSTFDQMTEVLLTIRKLFLDIEHGLFDDAEQTKRYYGSTVETMMEVWTSCCDVTVQCTDVLVKRLWSNTDEHLELIKAISRMSSTCTKLLVLMVDVVKHPVPEKCIEKVNICAIQNASCCSKSLEQLVSVLSTLPNGHPAEDAVLDISTWMLYGLQHVAVSVIKPGIDSETKEKNEQLFDFSNSLNTLFAILEDYETGPGLSPKKVEHANEDSNDKDTTEDIPDKEDPKKSAKGKEEKRKSAKDKGAKKDTKEKEDTKKHTKDIEEVKKDTQEKEEDQKTEKRAETINDCIRSMDRLGEEYLRFSETWLLNGKVGVVMEDNSDVDVTILFRPEQYIELAKCSIQPCVMAKRTTWLDELAFADDEIMVSDIYVVNNGPLHSVKDVVVDFPVMSQHNTTENNIHIKVKTEGNWNEISEVKQEMVAGILRVSFKINNMEAFVAYILDSSDTLELTPAGSTYAFPSDQEIKVIFQSGSVDENQNLKIKVLPYNEQEVAEYMEKCPNSIVGITAVSNAIEVRTDKKIDMKKNSFYQLPIDEIEDSESQIVVVRYNDEQIQILDKSQCHIKKVETGVYSVETRGIWCIAVARVKKIFLNMRDTLKKEFQVMHGKTQICNIVMMIDQTARSQSTGFAPFLIDCVDKMSINEFLEEKKKDGYIEVRNSRSKDINMHRRENMSLAIDGQIKILDNLQYATYTFTYLKGVDNHLSIPIQVKRDQEKMPYATFVFRNEDHDSTLHSVAIPVRDLAELPTDEISAVSNLKTETNNIRLELKLRDESARNVLSHESLMVMSRQLTKAEATQLAELLGVCSKKIKKFRESCDGDVVRTNFLTLCEWRGNYSRSAMVDFLINCLRSSGKWNFADVILRVRKLNRVLYDSDFV